MFKIATIALALLAACDAAAPARVTAPPPVVGLMAKPTPTASATCPAGSKCEADAECGDLSCVEGECVAPCEIDEHCLPGDLQPTTCHKGACRAASGAASCPAPCPAGEGCTSDADCGPLAPTCVVAVAGDKGQCVAPCASATDCHGNGVMCLAGVCQTEAGALACN